MVVSISKISASGINPTVNQENSRTTQYSVCDEESDTQSKVSDIVLLVFRCKYIWNWIYNYNYIVNSNKNICVNK